MWIAELFYHSRFFIIFFFKDFVSKIALVCIKTKPGALLLSHSRITVHVASVFCRIASITIIVYSCAINRGSFSSYALISHQNVLISRLLLIVFEGASFRQVLLLLRYTLYVHHLTRVAITRLFFLILLSRVMVTVHALIKVIILRRLVYSCFGLVEWATVRLEAISKSWIN